MSAGRMGPDEYFWNYDFRFDLRGATRGEQEAVRVLFLAQRLELDELTLRHVELVELVIGGKCWGREALKRAWYAADCPPVFRGVVVSNG